MVTTLMLLLTCLQDAEKVPVCSAVSNAKAHRLYRAYLIIFRFDLLSRFMYSPL